MHPQKHRVGQKRPGIDTRRLDDRTMPINVPSDQAKPNLTLTGSRTIQQGCTSSAQTIRHTYKVGKKVECYFPCIRDAIGI